MRPLISVPTRRDIHADTVAWLLAEFVRLAPEVEVMIHRDRRPLEHQRNAQVKHFLSTACTHLFLLDSDCVPQPDTLRRLLAHNLPLVTAPGRVLKEWGPMVMALDLAENGEYREHHGKGLQRVDATGCAGMLIRRDVLERLPPPWFSFRFDEQGLLIRGEDILFCEDVRNAGFPIHADLSLLQRHWVDAAL